MSFQMPAKAKLLIQLVILFCHHCCIGVLVKSNHDIGPR